MDLQYERNDINFVRNKFRVRGDTVEIYPANAYENAIRVEFFGDEIDRISEINTVTGEVKAFLSHAAIYPASHYIVSHDKLEDALNEIKEEMEERVRFLTKTVSLLRRSVYASAPNTILKCSGK